MIAMSKLHKIKNCKLSKIEVKNSKKRSQMKNKVDFSPKQSIGFVLFLSKKNPTPDLLVVVVLHVCIIVTTREELTFTTISDLASASESLRFWAWAGPCKGNKGML
jgi:hypothetical protein